MNGVIELILDETRISRYFQLGNDIKFISRRIEELEIEFRHKNYYTCIQEEYDTIRTVAFRIENEVTDHVTAIQAAEKRIKVSLFKEKHFERYLLSLDDDSRYYFIQRYKYHWEIINEKLDREIMEEIKEIEMATMFRFKPAFSYVIEKPKEVSEEFHVTDEDPEEYMERMMEMMGID